MSVLRNKLSTNGAVPILGRLSDLIGVVLRRKQQKA
jgi:hypothetical protein